MIKLSEFLKENNCYTRFINNCDKNNIDKNWIDIWKKTVDETISYAFEWDNTPADEGYYYWRNINKKWEGIEHKENDMINFFDNDYALKEDEKEASKVNEHYKKQGIDTITRCKANMTLEQQKAICIFNIDKYTWREKGQNLSDIKKIRDYLNWLEEIEIEAGKRED